MQFSQKLTRVLRELVSLIENEAAQNPEFAQRLEMITSELPTRGKPAARSRVATAVPDVGAAFQERGEAEFRFWLRSLDIPTLKAIVKANGFDPAKTSQRWREPDKFVVLIAEQTSARLRRGSSFVGSHPISASASQGTGSSSTEGIGNERSPSTGLNTVTGQPGA